MDGAGDRRSGFPRLRDRRFWRKKKRGADGAGHLGAGRGGLVKLKATAAGAGAGDKVSTASGDGGVFMDGIGLDGGKAGEMGFDVSLDTCVYSVFLLRSGIGFPRCHSVRNVPRPLSPCRRKASILFGASIYIACLVRPWFGNRLHRRHCHVLVLRTKVIERHVFVVRTCHRPFRSLALGQPADRGAVKKKTLAGRREEARGKLTAPSEIILPTAPQKCHSFLQESQTQ